MIEPAFSALPVELNSQTKTWLEVLKCTKKLWGEHGYERFQLWSKSNYNKSTDRNRDIWEGISGEELHMIVNPASVFLKHCTSELAGVCKLDTIFFQNSGTFCGHTAMAGMLSKWFSGSVVCPATVKGKPHCYIWSEEDLL